MRTSELTHGYLLGADPPGTENRRWRCQHCGMLGTMKELAAKKCPKARPATDEDLLAAIAGDGPKHVYRDGRGGKS